MHILCILLIKNDKGNISVFSSSSPINEVEVIFHGTGN